MKSNKSRRLRKKLYLDEFAIYGFEFSCEIKLEHESDFDTFLDEFLEFVEARELEVAAGGAPNTNDPVTFSGFACSEHRYGSATEADQAAVRDWLNGHALVLPETAKVGELVDANYGV